MWTWHRRYPHVQVTRMGIYYSVECRYPGVYAGTKQCMGGLGRGARYILVWSVGLLGPKLAPNSLWAFWAEECVQGSKLAPNSLIGGLGRGMRLGIPYPMLAPNGSEACTKQFNRWSGQRNAFRYPVSYAGPKRVRSLHQTV